MSPGTEGEYIQVGGAWVHRGAKLGEGVTLEPGALVGDSVVIGARCRIGPHAVIRGPTELGVENQVYAQAVLGEGPQDLGYRGEPTRLVIGDRNVIREGVTIHRGSVKGGGLTRVGSDNYFMAACHIGHDCVVGDQVVLANGVLIAGHCHIASQVNMAGGAAIVQFGSVGRLAFAGGLSGATRDLEPFLVHNGYPSRPRGVNVVGLRRAGIGAEAIRKLRQAYALLFADGRRGSEDVSKDREELARQGALCAEVEELLEFMDRTRGGKHGRRLQPRIGG